MGILVENRETLLVEFSGRVIRINVDLNEFAKNKETSKTDSILFCINAIL